MDGLLVIDKPAGLTSHDVVARARQIIGERRIGHTGTLDPFATGVLVLLVGQATRLAQFFNGADKEYNAVIRLGFSTDTGDLTGEKVNGASVAQARELRDEDIQAAASALLGEVEQLPPMYSAKRVGGQRLYEHARRGELIERQPITVNINKFEVAKSDSALKLGQGTTCDLRARVVCSAGTYIRTLAEDLGHRLGVGAHLAELRRTRAGDFTLGDALTLDKLRELSEGCGLKQAMVSPGAALAQLPLIDLLSDQVLKIRHGVDLRVEGSPDWPDTQPVRLRDQKGNLIAVGVYHRLEGIIHPRVVLADE